MKKMNLIFLAALISPKVFAVEATVPMAPVIFPEEAIIHVAPVIFPTPFAPAVLAAPTVQPAPSTEVKKSESYLYDLMYMPAKGTLAGSTELISSYSTLTLEYALSEFSKSETPATLFRQSLGYAIDSNRLVGIQLGYQAKSIETTKYGPGSNKNGQSNVDLSERGLSGVGVVLKERLRSQDENGYDVDVQISGSPKLGDNKRATKNAYGNAYSGNNSLAFDLALGKKNDESSWMWNFTYSYSGESTSVDAETPANKIVSESVSNFGLEFTYQWKINPSFLINFNTGLGILGKEIAANTYSHFKNEVETSTGFKIGGTFVLNYAPKSIFEIGLWGKSSTDRSLVQTSTINSSTTTLNIKEMTIGYFTVNCKYEF